jgi:hypothetical protein
MTRKTRWLRGRSVLLLGLAALLALAIGACGGGSSSDAGGSSETTASGGPGGLQLSDEQRSCIEDKGVIVPEPGNGQPPSGGPPSGGAPGGGDFQELQQALEDCGVNLPNSPPGGGNFDPSAIREQISQYAACVRKNGYDLPQPNTSGNGPVFDPSEVDQNDPEFKAASSKCRNLLPQGPASGQ